jgi:hypothetical protein
MTDLLRDAADLLRDFSPELADSFLARPFARVDLAFAFAAGFAKNDSDDVHPTASLVLRVALADRDHREKLAERDRLAAALAHRG